MSEPLGPHHLTSVCQNHPQRRRIILDYWVLCIYWMKRPCQSRRLLLDAVTTGDHPIVLVNLHLLDSVNDSLVDTSWLTVFADSLP